MERAVTPRTGVPVSPMGLRRLSESLSASWGIDEGKRPPAPRIGQGPSGLPWALRRGKGEERGRGTIGGWGEAGEWG
jgi:hypothetical protein